MTNNLSCYHFSTWAQKGPVTQIEFAIISWLNGITILPAIVLNTLVLISIWRTPALHTPSMVLMANLALSDLAVGAIAQPIMISYAALEFEVDNWPRTFCYVAMMFGNAGTVFGGVSTLSLTAIAFDRFLALHYHLRYPAIVTTKKAIAVCIVFWAFSFFLVAIWYTLGNKIYMFIVNVCIVVLFGITIVSYFKIYKVIKRHQTQIHVVESSVTACGETGSNAHSTPNIKRYKKSVMNSLVVYFVFVACSTPFACALAYWEVTQNDYMSPILVRLSTSVVFSNSCINPIIYCWKMRELREAAWQSATGLRDCLVGVKSRANKGPPSTAWITAIRY
ncbi:predicted protein [Nematostella vectensis]|uniref:G-protein coupled receptors family 1 profile domain-containing protein n=1 Tax=Nematostella vectensis TaxID=45351 RepID=A7RW09_NEMVE|nr:predicted protein [Nematostella vectensis]|eukprot:XP_001636394.1 predicted protein [Nematostella vectensis]